LQGVNLEGRVAPLTALILAVLVMAASAGCQQRPARAPNDSENDTVAVHGEAAEQRVAFGKPTTVLEAMSRARTTTLADLEQVVIVRLGPTALLTVVVDVRAMILTGNTTRNALLQHGDVLFVPRARRPARRSDADVVDEALDAILAANATEGAKAVIWAHRLTHHADPDARALAALEVGKLGSAAAPVVAQLVQALEQDRRVAREAIVALGMIGPDAAAAIPALQKLTGHEDRQIRERAKATLRQVAGRR
jgi:hypothetical protein